LKETGYVEGQNVAIEYRSAEDHLDRLPALVADLIRRPVAVIVGNHNAALAAKAATTTVPIVFVTGSDPIRDGLVTSLSRPGGNVTGVSFLAGILGTKRFELLRQLVPAATTIAVLVNPDAPDTEAERREVQGAAQTIGQQLIIVDARSDADIETAFATFVEGRAGALLVGTEAFMPKAGLARCSSAPRRSCSPIGAGRILKGEKPADLPVMQSIKFAFVINLKTAKALGLQIPDKLLALADEVIE
jgi:putative ABC transport system substrate-binding protein